MAAWAVAQPVSSAGFLASGWSVSPSPFLLVPLSLGIAPQFQLTRHRPGCSRLIFRLGCEFMPRMAVHWWSGSMLFSDKASDIGNDLIAMTPWRQQNRLSRSAE